MRAGRFAHIMLLVSRAWSGDTIAVGATILVISEIHCLSKLRCRVFNMIVAFAVMGDCSPMIAAVQVAFALVFPLFGPKKPVDLWRSLLKAAATSQKSWQATIRAEKVSGLLRCVYLGQESREHPGRYEPDPSKFDALPGDWCSRTEVTFRWVGPSLWRSCARGGHVP